MLGALRVEPGGSMEIIFKKKIKKLKDPAIRSKVELKGKDKERSPNLNTKNERKLSDLGILGFPGSLYLLFTQWSGES